MTLGLKLSDFEIKLSDKTTLDEGSWTTKQDTLPIGLSAAIVIIWCSTRYSNLMDHFFSLSHLDSSFKKKTF